MTYREALLSGEKILDMAQIVDAKNDAWLLMEMVCKIDKTFYYVHMDEEIPVDEMKEYESVLKKRAERVPLQYITGEQKFMGITFYVNSNVLIPRQDTETLVEEALNLAKPGMRILDMCTGSGCIIISILKNKSDVKGVGCDISKQALIVAKENAKLNNVNVAFEYSDLFENIEGKFDMIVSNPPYIRSAEIPSLMPEVAQFEPLKALDGSEDGLEFYRRIIKESKNYLNADGYIIFEIGNDQGEAVSNMLTYAGYNNVRVIKDLAHNDRVVCAQV